jgi:hypothetical protein
MTDAPPRRRIAFARIAAAALNNVHVLTPRWLPNGRRDGAEWVALNPRRNDRSRGSFKVNLHTGRWGDFALGPDARGGDLVSLASYLFELRQADAALRIAEMLGIDPYE